MNTKSIDVLGWLDACIEDEGNAHFKARYELARTAIAELIAALDEQRAADAKFNEAGRITPTDFKRLARADERVNAALARVKGEA